MAITVHLPSTLRGNGPDTRMVARATTIAELVAALDEQLPGVAFELTREDGMFNFAVNDEMLLSGADQHPLHDGDRVEIVPALSGG